MKNAKLIYSVTAALLLAIICPMPAHADLQSIVNDYCTEVESDVYETWDELQNHEGVMYGCFATYNDCLRGDLGIESADCANDYRVCARDALRVFSKACSLYLNDFRFDTKYAERRAYFEGTKDDFLDWFYGDTSVVSEPSSEECLGDYWDWRGSHFGLANYCAGPRLE